MKILRNVELSRWSFVIVAVVAAVGSASLITATMIIQAQEASPEAPTAVALQENADTGFSSNDGVTNWAADEAFGFDVEGNFASGARVDIEIVGPNGAATSALSTLFEEGTTEFTALILGDVFTEDGQYIIRAQQRVNGTFSEYSSPTIITIDRTAPTFLVHPHWIESADEFSGEDGIYIDAAEDSAGVNIRDIFTSATAMDGAGLLAPSIAYGKRTDATFGTPRSECENGYTYDLGPTLEYADIADNGSTVVCASATDLAGNVTYSNATEVLTVDLTTVMPPSLTSAATAPTVSFTTATTLSPTFSDDLTFTSGDDTITIAIGETRTISGTVDAIGGDDSIANAGTLIVRVGTSITNLEQFIQTSATGTLSIEIAENPNDGPVLDFGSADITISAGEIRLIYTGEWRPRVVEAFTLFSTSGRVTVSSSVQITGNDDAVSADYTGTQSGADPVSFNVRGGLPPYTPADFIETSDFSSGGNNTLTIQAGTTRIISGTISLGQGDGLEDPNNRIVNEGTLIIRSGSSFLALTEFIQNSPDAVLIIDITSDSPPSSDGFIQANFNIGVDPAIFSITGGIVHFNYSGAWRPLPFQDFFISKTINIFSSVNLDQQGSNPSSDTEKNFNLTHSAYGVPTDDNPTPDFPLTRVRILLPDGAVVGGPNATFTHVFTDGNNGAFISPGTSVRIEGSLDLLDGPVDAIHNSGTLTIDEGVTINGLSQNRGFGLTAGDASTLVVNVTRDDPSQDPIVTLPGANIEFDPGSSLHIEYSGEWKPAPDGEEFTLFGMVETANAVLPEPRKVSHSQDSSAIRLSVSGDSILAAIIPPIDDSTFGAGGDSLTIDEGTARIISGAVDFQGGEDSLTNEGTLIIGDGASIDNLELLTQTATDAVLTIEIAEDPRSRPAADFGSADVTISAGEIHISYTGSWRPQGGESFTLFSTNGSITVSPSVRITDNDDAKDLAYISTQSGTTPVNFIVNGFKPTLAAVDLANNDDTGSSDQDNITNRTLLTFNGVGAARIAAIAVFAVSDSGTTAAANTVPDENGDYSFELTLNEGVWQVTAIQTVKSFVAEPSDPLQVTVDRTPPTFITQPRWISDASVLSGGLEISIIEHLEGINIDDIFTPATATDGPGSAETAIAHGKRTSAANPDSNCSSYTYDLGPAPDFGEVITEGGRTRVCARATDIAGNFVHSDATDVLTVVSPPAPTSITLIPEHDTGVSDSDGQTNRPINQPFTFTVEGDFESGAVVSVRVSPQIFGTDTIGHILIDEYTTSVDISFGGNFFPDKNFLIVTATQTVGGTLSNGTLTGGITSDPSPSDTVVIDRLIPKIFPTQPSWRVEASVFSGGLEIVPGEEVGLTINDIFIPAFHGEAGVTFVYGKITSAGSEDPSADCSTYFYDLGPTLTYDEIDDTGRTRVCARATDVTGNVRYSEPTDILSINVPPAPPSGVRLIPQHDTGVSPSDGITNRDASGEFVFDVVGPFDAGTVITLKITPPSGTEVTRAVTPSDTVNSAAVAVEGINFGADGNYAVNAKRTALGLDSPFSEPVTITIDRTSPTASNVVLTNSDGNYPFFANENDVLTLTFDVNEPLGVSPTVIIGGQQSANVSNDNLTYAAARTVSSNETEALVTYAVTNIADIAGNTAADITETSSIAIDITAPATQGAIDDQILSVGEERVLKDITRYFIIEDGLSYRAASDNTSTVTVVLDNSNSDLTITGAALGTAIVVVTATDNAGNETAQEFEVSVTVSGPTVPTLPAIDLVDADDTGSSDQDDITNLTELNFTGDGAEPNVAVTVTANSNSGGTIVTAAVTSNANGDYSVDITLTQGIWRIIAIQTVNDIDSAASAPLQVTVDNTPPIVSGATFTNSDENYPLFANVNDVLTLTFAVDAATTMTPVVTIGGQPADVSKEGLIYTAVRTVNGDEGEGDVTYEIGPLADLAGNSSNGIATISEITIDTTAPAPQGAIENQNLPAGTNIVLQDITQYFTDENLLIYGAASDDTSIATVALDNNSNNFTITGVTPGIADVTVTATDTAGNETSQEFEVTVSVPVIPTLAAVDLDEQDDTGSSDEDNITNQTAALTFTGDDAEANAEITIIATPASGSGASVTVNTIADGGGDYSANLTLEEGIWMLTAVQTVNDFTSAPSPVLQVTIDITPPTPRGTISDQVVVAGGVGVLPNTAQYFEPDGDVLIFTANSSDTSSAAVDINPQNSNLTITGVAQGGADITVTATDTAGNQADQTFAVTVIPTGLDAPDLSAENDSGRRNDDNVTNQTTLRFSGTSSVTNADVTVVAAPAAGSLVTEFVEAQATPDADGTYSAMLTLTEGVWQVAAVIQTVSSVTMLPVLEVTIDLTNPAPRGTISDQVVVAGGGIGVLPNTAQYFEPDGDVLIFTANSSDTSSAAVDINPQNSSLTITGIAQGGADITVTAEDAAGNQAEQTFAVTVIPTGLDAPDLSAENDSGRRNDDNVTSQTTLRFSGTSSVTNADVTVVAAPAAGSLATEFVEAQATPDADGAYSVTLMLTEGVWQVAAVTQTVSSVTMLPVLEVTIDLTNPAPRGAISDQVVVAGGGIGVLPNTAQYFEPDGDVLIFTVNSSDTSSAAVDINPQNSSLTITGVAQGSADITVTAEDTAGNQADQTFAVTVIPTGLDAPDLSAEDDSGRRNDDNVTNQTNLRFSGTSSVTNADVIVIAAPVAGSLATNIVEAQATPDADGAYSAMLTLTEGVWQIAAVTQTVSSVTMLPVLEVTIDLTNPAPRGTISDQVVVAGGGVGVLPNTAQYFEPDRDVLIFTANSSDTSSATVDINPQNSSLTITGVAQGGADITVTAEDTAGNQAEQTFAVTVIPTGLDAPDLSAEDDSGRRNDDNVTNQTNLRFSGTSSVTNADVIVVAAPAAGSLTTEFVVAQATPDADGAYSATLMLTEGVWQVAAGTQTVSSVTMMPVLEVTIDLTNPAPRGAISDQVVVAGGGVGVLPNTAQYFEPDRDVLIFTANSSDTSSATVDINPQNSSLTITGIAQGGADITVTATDTAGNQADQTFAVTVIPTGLDAPDLSAENDSGRRNDDNVTNQTNLRFSGTSSVTNADVTVVAAPAAGSLATEFVEAQATPDADGAYSATLMLTEGVWQVAAVTQTVSSVTMLPALEVTIDLTNPAPQGTISDQVVVAGGGVGVLPNTAQYFEPDRDVLIFTANSSDTSSATVDINPQNSSLTITGVAQGGADITVTATDTAGNQADQTFAVTVIPTGLDAPDLSAENDSGRRNDDNVTNQTNLRFSGTSSVANADVTVVAAPAAGSLATEFVEAQATPDADGAYSATLMLTEGVWQVAAVIQTVSSVTMLPALEVTIDLTKPAPRGTISDQVVVAGGGVGVLPNTAQYFEPDRDVLIFTANSSDTSSAAVDIDPQNSSLTITGIAQGGADITVTAEDTAGNQAEQTFAVTVIPTGLDAPDLSAEDDSGRRNDDNVTNQTNLRFSGTSSVTNADVTVVAAPAAGSLATNIVEAQVTSDADGAYSATLILTEGVWQVAAVTQTVSSVTMLPVLEVTIDLTNPAPRGAISDQVVVAGVGVGVLPNTAQYFEPDRDVLIFTANSSDTSSAAVDINPQNSSLTITGVAQGGADITVTAEDTAGNQAEQTFAVTVIPTGLDAPDLSAEDDSGRRNDDNVTNQTTLRFSGTSSVTNADVTVVAAPAAGSLTTELVEAQATSDADGAYSATLTLTEGVWQVAAVTQTVSSVTMLPVLEVTIDLTNPAPRGSISDQVVVAGGGVGVLPNTAQYFEPDRDVLIFTANSSDTSSAAVDINPQNSSLTITGVAQGGADITVTAEDTAGNQAEQTLAVTVIPTGLDAPDLSAEDDSGRRNDDNVTNQTNLRFSGTSSVTNADVTVVAAPAAGSLATELVEAQATPDADGAYSATLMLTEGVWQVAAVIQTVSSVTMLPVLEVTIDLTNPAPQGTIESQALSVGEERVLQDITRYFIIEGGLSYGAASDDTSIVTVVLDNSSNDLTITGAALGTATVAVTAADTAGNETAQEFEVAVFVPALAAPDLEPSKDSGESAEDNITNQNFVTFVGQGAITTALVIVTATPTSGAAAIASVSPDPSGGYSAILNLAQGVWLVTATHKLDGINSAPSPALRVTVDNTPPIIPGATFTNSDENYPLLANVNDVLTLTFAVDAAITMTPAVTIGGRPADVSKEGLTYTAVITVNGDEGEGDVIYEIGPLSDLAGNSSNGIATISEITIDTTDPSISGTTLTSSDTNYPFFANEGDILTLTFDADGALDMTPTVTIGGQSADDVSKEGLTYTAVRTVNGDEDEGDVTYVIANIADIAGNTAANMTAISDTIAIDTTAPQTTGSITAQNLEQGETRELQNLAQYFNGESGLTYGAVSGNTDTATVAVNNDALTIAGVEVGMTTIAVTAADNAGNQASQEFDVTVSIPVIPKLLAPDLAPEDDSGSNNDNITNRTELTFTGDDAEPNAAVTVTATPNSGGTIVTAAVISNANGDYSANLTLEEGIWMLTAIQAVNDIDSAPSDPLQVTLDTTTPTISGANLTNSDGDYPFLANVNDILILTFDVDEASTTTPTVTIGGQPADVSKEGFTYTAARTVNGDEDEGPVEYVITNIADIAGNTAAATTETSDTIAIDTIAPATQGTMDDQTLIVGTNSVIQDITQYFADEDGLTYGAASDDTSTVTVVLDNSSNNLTITGEASGTATVAVTATDAAGNETTRGFDVAVFIPDLAAPDLERSNDSGESDEDNITNRNLLSFSGGGAIAATTVNITATPTSGAAITVSATSDANGNYSANLSLAEGVWQVTSTQTVGGTTSEPSPILRVIVDNTEPIVRETIQDQTVAAGGRSTVEGIAQRFEEGASLALSASSNNPNVAAPALDTVTSNLTITGVAVGTATLAITAEDTAGNRTDLAFGVQVFNLDTLPTPDLLDNFDTGMSNQDDLTNITSIAVGIRSVVGNTVAVTAVTNSGTTVTATVMINPSEGTARAELLLAEGIWQITATQAADGVVSDESSALLVTVDTTPPTPQGTILNKVVIAGGEGGFLPSLSWYFEAEQGGLTFTAASSNTSAVVLNLDPQNSSLAVIGVQEGEADVTVTAEDTAGNQAGQTFNVMVVTTGLDAPDLNPGDDSGDRDDDNLTNVSDPEFSGTSPVTDTVITIVAIPVTGPELDIGQGLTWAIDPAPDGTYSTMIPLPEGVWQVGATTGPVTTVAGMPLLEVIIDFTSPENQGSIGDQTVVLGVPFILQDIPQYFTGAGPLTYLSASDDPSIVTSTVNAMSDLVITGLIDGVTTITVTAEDLAGNGTAQTFVVTVARQGGPSGSAPSINGRISDRTVNQDMGITISNVAQFFTDTDALTYSADSSNPSVATAVVGSNNDLTVTGRNPGIVTITITATDTERQTAELTFTVIVVEDSGAVEIRNVGGDPVAFFTIVESPETSPDVPPPPTNVRFVYPAYDVTPTDTGGAELHRVYADVCLPFGNFPRPAFLSVYHYSDGVWERLPNYINDANTHVCGTTESFPLFVLGFAVERQVTAAGLLPPTGGITPGIWVIIAAAAGGLMALVASAAFGMTALSLRHSYVPFPPSFLRRQESTFRAKHGNVTRVKDLRKQEFIP